jgi:hypothetical protein
VPTYEALPRFAADHHRLTPEQRRRFRQAVTAFVDDLRTGRFRAEEIVRGERHITWRRIGGHDIFAGP